MPRLNSWIYALVLYISICIFWLKWNKTCQSLVFWIWQDCKYVHFLSPDNVSAMKSVFCILLISSYFLVSITTKLFCLFSPLWQTANNTFQVTRSVIHKINQHVSQKREETFRFSFHIFILVALCKECVSPQEVMEGKKDWITRVSGADYSSHTSI